MLESLLELIFPKRCINCKKEGCLLCKNCEKEILLEPYSIKNYHNLEAVFIACRRSNLLKKLIYNLKYRFKEELVSVLGDVLIHTLSRLYSGTTTILVPVPLHFTRKFCRGFNQSEILAQYISKKHNIKTYNLLYRNKKTSTQTNLSREERFINVKNIFGINYKYLKNIQKETCNVIILDDITTTGATLSNAALALKGLGFYNIYGLSVCKGL